MWIKVRQAENDSAGEPRHPREQARLRAWVERLAVPRHRFANAGGNRQIREAVGAELERLGLSARFQGQYANVVALPRASTGRPLTLVAAHYDSVPDCPGADDNASGLAAMLECARAISETSAATAVGFVGFNAEEDGLLGSRDFVSNGLRELGRPVHAVHVLEMVGYLGRRGGESQELPLPWVPERFRRPDFIGLLTNGRSNASVDCALASSVAPGLRLLTAKTWGPLHLVFPDLTRSDHMPFWSAGIRAALWTDTGNFRNPHYHRTSDTPDTLDYAFLRRVTELLCSVVSREATPRASGRAAG